MIPIISQLYNLSVPKNIDDDDILEDLDTQELCPEDLDHNHWDSSVTGKPVKVYDLLVGFPNGRVYALVNFDEEDPDNFDIMVPWAWLSEIPLSVKLCTCGISVIMARGCQCGGK